MKNLNNMDGIMLFIKNIPELVFIKNKNLETVFLNEKFEKLLHKPLYELLGKNNYEIWPKNIANKLTESDLETFKLDKGQYVLIEESLESDGEKNTYIILKFPIKNEKNETSLIGGISVDIKKLKEKKLEKEYVEFLDVYEKARREKIIFNMAYYDELTGLPNRRFFKEKLKRGLKEGNKGIVLFLDLDNFKNINETLGHDIGDELLKVISYKLKEALREEDVLARFGGDEFLILQPNINKREEAIKSANKILNVFKDLWQVRENKIHITASIGITEYPNDSSDLNIILRNVDTAVYDAKSSGKNIYKFFEKSMYNEMLRKTKIEKALREAINNDELKLYYQPQVEVKTGKIVSLEALIRWSHPEMGVISPMEFIPIAEETGLIVDIGEWVLRTACKQNKEWKDKGYKYNTVAVNVSSVQLRQRGFVHLVKNILQETKLDPQFLELEITESVLMQSLQKSIKIFEELRKIGVKTALDDFGTGYSSLNYLMKIPIDTVKIDKGFIDNICVNCTQKSVIEGIILIAHEMKLDVVAEGVEIEEQLKILANKKCDKIQGYFFSKPYEATSIEKILQKGFFAVSV